MDVGDGSVGILTEGIPKLDRVPSLVPIGGLVLVGVLVSVAIEPVEGVAIKVVKIAEKKVGVLVAERTGLV